VAAIKRHALAINCHHRSDAATIIMRVPLRGTGAGCVKTSFGGWPSVWRRGVELAHNINKRFRGLQGDEVRHGPSASRLAANDADLKPHGSGDLDIVDHAPLGATLQIGAT
jgi:hypothetical protein